MSKSRMRGHFRYPRFKTFPMTPRTPQCEVFWSSKSSSEFSRVPEDSNPNFFQVLGFTLTLGQSGVATLKKRDATSDYARTNNLHVMWSGGIIDTRDGHDLLNVIFQSRNSNRIIARLEMFVPFKNLHWEDRDNFITSVIQVIGNFFIHEEML
jgi:hypothetical protein